MSRSGRGGVRERREEAGDGPPARNFDPH